MELAAPLAVLWILVSVYLFRRWRLAQAQAVRAGQLREDERRGRVAAERRLAACGSGSVCAEEEEEGALYAMAAIGHISSVFAHRNGTPRSSGLVATARARVVLDRRRVSPVALTGLGEFSHVWVVFVFHGNTNRHKSARAVRPLVAPPRLQGREGLPGGRARRVGVFATRTPHRPNPIGLSLVRIERVLPELGVVLLAGVDLLDGTPVLDLKPYSPLHDAWPDPMALRVPAWLEEPLSELPVALSAAAREALRRLRPNSAKPDRPLAARFFPRADDAERFLCDALRVDIRSAHRKAARADEEHFVVLDGLLVGFHVVAGARVDVFHIENYVPETCDRFLPMAADDPEARPGGEMPEALCAAPNDAGEDFGKSDGGVVDDPDEGDPLRTPRRSARLRASRH